MANNEEKKKKLVLELDLIEETICDLEDLLCDISLKYDKKRRWGDFYDPSLFKKEEDRDRKLVISQIYQLNKRNYIVKDEIALLSPSVKSNGVIELKQTTCYDYQTGEGIKGEYSIVLSGSNIIIGKIDYKGYHVGDIGDIGYQIYEPYRGNHYAYQALCLLSEYLFENGVLDFWIAAYKTNTPSLKTIRKYGVCSELDSGYKYLFMAYTRVVKKDNDRNRKD